MPTWRSRVGGEASGEIVLLPVVPEDPTELLAVLRGKAGGSSPDLVRVQLVVGVDGGWGSHCLKLDVDVLDGGGEWRRAATLGPVECCGPHRWRLDVTSHYRLPPLGVNAVRITPHYGSLCTRCHCLEWRSTADPPAPVSVELAVSWGW